MLAFSRICDLFFGIEDRFIVAHTVIDALLYASVEVELLVLDSAVGRIYGEVYAVLFRRREHIYKVVSGTLVKLKITLAV